MQKAHAENSQSCKLIEILTSPMSSPSVATDKPNSEAAASDSRTTNPKITAVRMVGDFDFRKLA